MDIIDYICLFIVSLISALIGYFHDYKGFFWITGILVGLAYGVGLFNGRRDR